MLLVIDIKQSISCEYKMDWFTKKSNFHDDATWVVSFFEMWKKAGASSIYTTVTRQPGQANQPVLLPISPWSEDLFLPALAPKTTHKKANFGSLYLVQNNEHRIWNLQALLG